MQRALLRTVQEIAKGMDYIHSFGIIHGDLKLGNVLLKTHRVDRRGYVAKVSDFGQLTTLLPFPLYPMQVKPYTCLPAQSHWFTATCLRHLNNEHLTVGTVARSAMAASLSSVVA